MGPAFCKGVPRASDGRSGLVEDKTGFGARMPIVDSDGIFLVRRIQGMKCDKREDISLDNRQPTKPNLKLLQSQAKER
jgi:hypothetical protein